MKLRSVASLFVLIVGGVGTSSAQDAINIADLVLAVRNGLIEAQRRQTQADLVPMFLVKDFEMSITFVGLVPGCVEIRIFGIHA